MQAGHWQSAAGGVEEHLWVDTHVPEGVVARPDVTPHGPGSGALSCWTELVNVMWMAQRNPDGQGRTRAGAARRLRAAVARGGEFCSRWLVYIS